MGPFNSTVLVAMPLSIILVILCSVNAYAQLADTMLCEDESCSETISEGVARLAYRPRDEKFLNLKKGDVVLVKSKNAGEKTHLWGGQVMGNFRFGFFPSSFIKEYIVLVKYPSHIVSIQEFLKERSPPSTHDPYSGLVGVNQKITFDKSKKKDDDKHHFDDTPQSVDGRVNADTERIPKSEDEKVEESRMDAEQSPEIPIDEERKQFTDELNEKKPDEHQRRNKRSLDEDNQNEKELNEGRPDSDIIRRFGGESIEKEHAESREETSEGVNESAADPVIPIEATDQGGADKVDDNELRQEDVAANIPSDIATLLGKDIVSVDGLKTKDATNQQDQNKALAPSDSNESNKNDPKPNSLSDDSHSGSLSENPDSSKTVEDTSPNSNPEVEKPKKNKSPNSGHQKNGENEENNLDRGMPATMADIQAATKYEENSDSETTQGNPIKLENNPEEFGYRKEHNGIQQDVDNQKQIERRRDREDQSSEKEQQHVKAPSDHEDERKQDNEQVQNHYFLEKKEDGVVTSTSATVVSMDNPDSDEKQAASSIPSRSSGTENQAKKSGHSHDEPSIELSYSSRNPSDEMPVVKDSSISDIHTENNADVERDKTHLAEAEGTTKETSESELSSGEVKQGAPGSTLVKDASSVNTEDMGDLQFSSEQVYADQTNLDARTKDPVDESIEGSDIVDKVVDHTSSSPDMAEKQEQPHLLGVIGEKVHKQIGNSMEGNDVESDRQLDAIDTLTDDVEDGHVTNKEHAKDLSHEQNIKEVTIESDKQQAPEDVNDRGGEDRVSAQQEDETKGQLDVAIHMPEVAEHRGAEDVVNKDEHTSAISHDKNEQITKKITVDPEIQLDSQGLEGKKNSGNENDLVSEHQEEAKGHRDHAVHIPEAKGKQGAKDVANKDEHASAIDHEQNIVNDLKKLPNAPVLKENKDLGSEHDHASAQQEVKTKGYSIQVIDSDKPEDKDEGEDDDHHNEQDGQSESDRTSQSEGIHANDDKTDSDIGKENKDESSQSKESQQRLGRKDIGLEQRKENGGSKNEVVARQQHAGDKHFGDSQGNASKSEINSNIDSVGVDGMSKDIGETSVEPVQVVDGHKSAYESEAESVLQMANPDNKLISNHEESDDKKDDSSSEKYNALHEGKVVNWDEMIEEKSEKDKPVGWDESLGGNIDSEQVTANPEKTDYQENVTRDGTTTVPPPSDVHSTQHSGQDTVKPITTTPAAHGAADAEANVTEDQILEPSPSVQPDNQAHDEKDFEQNNMIDEGENKFAETETQVEPTLSVKKYDNKLNGEMLEKDNVEEPEVEETEDKLHVKSFWLRLLLVFSKLPYDIIYIMEPLFHMWIALLPEEYQNDLFGVSWSIITSTFFIGFALIWLLVCRSRASKRKCKDQHSVTTIQELKTQLENLSQEKIDIENELRTKQNEVEIQREQMVNATEEKNVVATAKRGLEHSLREHNAENEALKRELQILNQNLQEKDHSMQEVLSNSQQVERSLVAQQEAIAKYEGEIAQLQGLVSKHESDQSTLENSNEKLKERLKTLERARGETKKEGKTLKEQIEKLNTKMGELQDRLDAEIDDGGTKKQEIDVLKDCILQFKGVQEYLTDEGDDAETEEAIEKQKEKMKSMIDVANVRNVLRQSEAEKLQVTYELEAERKSRLDTEGKVSELEATIQGNEAMKNKLEREKQILDSKLTVMQEFYAKREVEIQSKLGFEQSKRESNATLLEDQQQQQLEMMQQLDAYKKMSEDAKRKYEDSERQHKQEILGFEKKSHDNWLACRDAERKTEESNKQISQLHLELTDMRHRLRDSQDREPIIRPRPERHGPPGAPPPFGPPRRIGGPPPPGITSSPLHFRNGPPPDADRRSPPPHHRRPPSPGGSDRDRPPSRPDRPPSRPDRPPSTHSLPPMDRRAMPGPPHGPGQTYTNSPGREYRQYRDGMPPMRPPLRDSRQPPPGLGPRMTSGPMHSSPYMERPPIPSSQSLGPRSQNFTQSTLHATPPQSTGDGLRNDGQHPPMTGTGHSEPPPPGAGRDPGASNPFRRSRP